MNRSLRRRLTLGVLGPALLVLAGILVAYRIAERVVGDAYDASLLNLAEGTANHVRLIDGQLALAFPDEAEQLLRTDRVDRIFFRVRSDAGQWIAGDRGLPPPEPPDGEGGASFYEVIYRDVAVRGVRIHRIHEGQGFFVTVAETRHKRAQALEWLLFGFGAVLIFASLAVFWIVRFVIPTSLRPLRQLEQTLAARGADDLSAIDPAGVPREVRGVVGALNAMFARRDAAGAAQRDFLQNAAHELRTPLAALQVQIERLGPSPSADEVARLSERVQRTTRLANQLLSLARVDAMGQWAGGDTPVALDALIDEQVEEWLRRADARGIDLGIERDPACVPGEPTLLRELLSNLVDNALKYAPAGGRVSVRCRTDAERVRIEVEDNGPGIPPEWREKAFERFARMPGSAVPGSGLGLAIVREIVRAHGGQVMLDTSSAGGGLLVRVSLPAVVIA
ncbi:sensor histidine kinase [Nitrogeniibacter aestuarii]|uniref:sensor histidine kinase n=1 Tax=Nitrogeniibacter aestuarii TaxID=2815343 RepID=UPI001D11560B|nr:sensor histidine kinase [Nitrogeniibacter aestuarii]